MHSSMIRNLTRQPSPLPGRQAAVHQHRQQLAPGVVPRAPVGVQGGRGRGAQGQQRLHARTVDADRARDGATASSYFRNELCLF